MATPDPASALAIPDSLLAREATAILREHSTDLLYNHSIRVYLFAAEQGRRRTLRFDPELLYVAAAFHDLGLIRRFVKPEQLSRMMQASMRPRRVRLGCDDAASRGDRRCRGFNEAEARAPRMRFREFLSRADFGWLQ